MVSSVLRFKVTNPIRVYCDNMGDHFLYNNYEGKRTKYLDIRYHFVSEYVHEVNFTVIFVPTEENKSDLFKKNFLNSIFSKNKNYLEILELYR